MVRKNIMVVLKIKHPNKRVISESNGTDLIWIHFEIIWKSVSTMSSCIQQQLNTNRCITLTHIQHNNKQLTEWKQQKMRKEYNKENFIQTSSQQSTMVFIQKHAASKTQRIIISFLKRYKLRKMNVLIIYFVIRFSDIVK